jgi:hypothetical protein
MIELRLLVVILFNDSVSTAGVIRVEYDGKVIMNSLYVRIHKETVMAYFVD